MNISLNLTLLIQIINFLIAYYFISKFFLKPALSIFEKDKDYLDNLKENISFKKNKILALEKDKEFRWKEFQSYYKKIIPNQKIGQKTDQGTEFNKLKFDDLSLKSINKIKKEELDQLVKVISNSLKSKVIND